MATETVPGPSQGFALDALGKKKLLRITDGDTPIISMSIRMLSIDTPELHYEGSQNTPVHDAKFKDLAQWVRDDRAPVGAKMKKYLLGKLKGGEVGTLQHDQGKKATEAMDALLIEKLGVRANGDYKRNLYIRAAQQHFDHYGRLLAYISPSYTRKELKTMTLKQRATFNLLIVETGWSATFPIYPNLPKKKDMDLLIKVADDAVTKKKGAWDNPLSLTGYEYRMFYRLWKITKKLVDKNKDPKPGKNYGWVKRYCANWKTKALFPPEDYIDVPPQFRVFFEKKDLAEAVPLLKLKPEGFEI